MYVVCKIYTFLSHLTWLSQKTVDEGEKLLTYLNSALKVLLRLDIFPSCANKKLNFVVECSLSAATCFCFVSLHRAEHTNVV